MSPHSETRRRLWLILLENFRRDKSQPSIRGLMKLLKVTSPSVIQYHLTALKNAGFIQIDACKTRTLKLLRGTGIPILGRVAAGIPLDNFEQSNFEQDFEEIPLSPQAFGLKSSDLYALQVHGDSMIGANIQDGDYAIIQKQSQVEHGQIAAVLIDGQGTLKRVRYVTASSSATASNSTTASSSASTTTSSDPRTELHSENPKYPPILLSENKNNVLFGKMIGLFRTSV